MAVDVDMKALLESGAHFGHKTSRWHPKMAPYIQQMRQNIADDCGIAVDCVNVKATTEEGLGFTGELLGISAHAVCIIE